MRSYWSAENNLIISTIYRCSNYSHILIFLSIKLFDNLGITTILKKFFYVTYLCSWKWAYCLWYSNSFSSSLFFIILKPNVTFLFLFTTVSFVKIDNFLLQEIFFVQHQSAFGDMKKTFVQHKHVFGYMKYFFL